MPLALYRKHRPQKLSEIIGHEYLVEIFKNAAKKNKLAHAYLFYGSRGTGKTTLARLIAKLANCQTQKFLEKNGDACGRCRACQEINNGLALDIIEIDAASNRGIDEIRNLKESVKLSPSSLRKKVFIIDETHMLTKDAFNALLKTLEEPPKHAMLILATTEYEKIPPTIISRVQKFYFKKLTISEIVQKIKKICSTENIKINEEAVELIAAAAEGSLRDAESLLDQLSSLSTAEEEINLSAAEKVIGQIGFKKVIKLADLIINKNLKGVLEYLSELNSSGFNLTDLNKELIFYLRRVLSLKFDPQLEQIFAQELISEELNQIKKHSQIIQPDRHINLLKSLIRAHSEMRYSPFAIVPLEVALIENLK